jgi:hypothetical protein
MLSGLRFIALGTTFVNKHHQNISFMNSDRGFFYETYNLMAYLSGVFIHKYVWSIFNCIA